NIRFIKVLTPSVSVSIIFALPILGSSQNLNANATAGLSIPGNARFCIFPLSAVQCDDTDPACTLSDPNTKKSNPSELWGNCPGGDPYALQSYTVKDASGKDVTVTCDPKREFCPKCVYTMRSSPKGGPSAGNFNVLGCAGNGDNDVRNALAATGTSCQCGAV